MSNLATCKRFLCPVLVSSTSSGTALIVSMVMHCTGQARSHCTQPIQSSIFTNSCIREFGGSSQRSSGYCSVTAGTNSLFHVNRMPISGVLILSQIFTRYCHMLHNPSFIKHTVCLVLHQTSVYPTIALSYRPRVGQTRSEA